MIGRTLVTGGAGFIGSHLVDALMATGSPVTVLDDLSAGDAGNLAMARVNGDLRFIQGSILNQRVLEQAMADCDRVFHMAVQCVRRSLANPIENHEVNATGTLNVLEAARRNAIVRFIYCSSSEVYGNSSDGLLHEDTTVCRPVTVYGAAKLAGEFYTDAYRRTYGLPTQIVRPFNAYGPRAHVRGELAEVIPRFVIRVLNGRPPVVFGSGANGRDFTYVTEVARGLLIAGYSDNMIGTCVNIAYGSKISVEEVARAVMRTCGRNDLTMQIASPRPGDVRMLRADTGRAEKLLGYRPNIHFDDGLQLYINWFKEAYPNPSILLEDEVTNWGLPAQTKRGAA